MGQLEVVKVPVESLETGMYVSSLDRPWLETPFMTQGFTITGRQQIDKLAEYCKHVYIDTKKGISAPATTAKAASGSRASIGGALDKASKPSASFVREMSSRLTFEYKNTSPLLEEMEHARKIFTRMTDEFQSVAENIRRGSALRLSTLSELVPSMVESVVRNPGASIWLAQLKNKDSYTYRHCLSVVVWCTVVGRQLGLPKKELQLLATGGMMMDIGKLKLPEQLLNKTGKLTEREFSLMKRHIDISLMMARDSGVPVPNAVLDMIRYHHERWDGTGYPKGLAGDKIPLYARIGAIADCYDAITSPRAYAKPVPHIVAMKNMYKWRGTAFQAELVDAFIQSVGIYPVGTIVELTSGEVGIVTKENPGRRLRPQLLIVMNKDKQMMDAYRKVNMAEDDDYNIYHALEPGAYGLNPEEMDFSGIFD